MKNNVIKVDDGLEEKIKAEITASFQSQKQRILNKVVGAALDSVPWVGGYLSAYMSMREEKGQMHTNELYKQWLEEHSNKMKALGETLLQVLKRLDEYPTEFDSRLESEQFLQIVRRSFRSWDNSDTIEKREIIRKLLTNASTEIIIDDNLVRLFLDWIDKYHEAHFLVIKTIYDKPGITRYQIWKEIHGEIPREDSLEADLFKLLIHDLSTGMEIRQYRDTDYSGNFIKKKPAKKSFSSNTYKSAFDDEEPYSLTELGKTFVRYTMDEVAPQIG